jgi:transcriptional regulator with XRE-family HTH domain
MKPQDAVIRLLNAGWTQVRLADVVDTSQSTIHRIKSGTMRRGVPFELAMALIALAEGLPGKTLVEQAVQEQRAP